MQTLKKISDEDKMAELDIDILQRGGVGINIDSYYLINPEKYEIAKQIQRDVKLDPTVYDKYAEKLSTDNKKLYPYDIQFAAEHELAKKDAFESFIGSMPDACDIRIMPHPPESPFTTQYALGSMSKDDVVFSDEVKSQLSAICNKASNNDTILQISPYTKGKGVHLPYGKEQEAYTNMCRAVIEASGRQNGKGLVLELGNELNASQSTVNANGDKMFEGNNGFPEQYIPAKEYGKWYYQVASTLKSEYPDLKCAPTGMAFFDKEYLAEMAQTVLENDNGADTIDMISFHPYRSKQSDGTAVVSHGNIQNESMPYSKQVKHMHDLAKIITNARSDGGKCKAVVGEISYYQPEEFQKSVDYNELMKEAKLSGVSKMKSYIWPSVSMTFPSKMEDVHMQAKRSAEAKSFIDNTHDDYIPSFGKRHHFD